MNVPRDPSRDGGDTDEILGRSEEDCGVSRTEMWVPALFEIQTAWPLFEMMAEIQCSSFLLPAIENRTIGILALNDP